MNFIYRRLHSKFAYVSRFLTSHVTHKDMTRDIGQQSLFDFQRSLTASSGVAKTPKIQHSLSIKRLNCLSAQLRAVNFEPTDLAYVSIRCLTGLIRCLTLEIIFLFKSRSIRPGKNNGGGEGVRTPDLRLAKPALCQTELRPRTCLREGWLRGRDLNPRPLGYEPNELPDCSTPRQILPENVVGLGRFELPTSRLSGVRSNQLSYRPVSLLRRIQPQKRATLHFECGSF
jgi:hypothetical protein